MGILRDKKPLTLNVTVGDRTKVWAELYGGAKATSNDSAPEAFEMKFGMSVQPLRASDREQMKLKGSGGVLIASVEPGSFADDIGLGKGDVILELNRQPVGSNDDVKRLQSALKPGDAVAFHVMRQLGGPRGGEWQPLFLAGKVPDSTQ
jgi:serine protease Do